MAIEVCTNSWVTISYADTYFAERFGSETWATFSEAQKTILLIHAYRWIRQQSDINILGCSTNFKVKQAQCELAWYIYNYFAAHEKRRALFNSGVTRFQISKFSENLRGAQFPDFIKDMLEDFLTGLGGKFPIISREFQNNNTA